MAKKELDPVEKLNYEQAFGELEGIVAALESGEHSLDESLRLYERGQLLMKHCAVLLQQAELKVRELDQADEAEGG
jgi:exodeoxyribonuclease VII small subunit